MRKYMTVWGLLVGLFLASTPAGAQQVVAPCTTTFTSVNGAQQQNCARVSEGGGLPVVVAGASFTNITTSTDTNVKASPGVISGILVNTGGTTSTLKLYNDADGTCSSGLIGTWATTAVVALAMSITASVGICAKTAGGAPADVTILYR